MVALRGDRPFSLDEKLGSVDAYLPPGRRVCELRLLAVRPEHRKGRVFKGLVDGLVREGRRRGYDLAVISGTVRQAKLYRHLGFVPFGPRVGTDEAPFQPMYITFEDFLDVAPAAAGEPASFLPGPVPLADDVRRARARAGDHRDQRFREFSRRALVRARRRRTSRLGSARSPPTASPRRSLLDAPGVVLSNGELRRAPDRSGAAHAPEHTPASFGWASGSISPA
jgi:hypothetical protein